MARLHCPNVVAAAERLAEQQKAADGRCLWALGDALIKDCGYDEGGRHLPPRSGVRNGSKATLELATAELKTRGIEYTADVLRKIRDVAVAFKKSDRVDGLGFWAHEEAGNPACLKWIIKTTPRREKKDRFGFIPVVTIREKATQYREAQRQEQERRFEAAQERVRRATSVPERRRAQEEAEELRGMPRSRVNAITPPASALRTAANTMGIDAELERAKSLIQEALPKLRALSEINADFADGFIEDCTEIKAACDHIINFLRGSSNVVSIRGGRSA